MESRKNGMILTPQAPVVPPTESQLKAMLKPELETLCKRYKKSHAGNKGDLLKRLLDHFGYVQVPHVVPVVPDVSVTLEPETVVTPEVAPEPAPVLVVVPVAEIQVVSVAPTVALEPGSVGDLVVVPDVPAPEVLSVAPEPVPSATQEARLSAQDAIRILESDTSDPSIPDTLIPMYADQCNATQLQECFLSVIPTPVKFSILIQLLKSRYRANLYEHIAYGGHLLVKK